MKNIILILVIMLISNRQLIGQSPDRKAVYNASMDYIDAMYKSEPFRIERSVDRNVVRRGFYWKGIDSTYSDMRMLNYDQMVQLAKDWNKSHWLPADAVKKVDVYDVLDKTACSRVTTYWGMEYLQLAKLGDHWVIVNILWQSLPKTTHVPDQQP